ncbi:MAG: glycosyltransferase family 4 protein [Planctomycetes bacterium]|nr:glycosyltransferase family 4 protein [Planctomycetota bacterium]
MRITVFSRTLSNRPTGRGVYAGEMIRALSELPEIEALEVFGKEPIDVPKCRFWPACGRNGVSDATAVLWRIGKRVKEAAGHVFWATTHFLPSRLPQGLPVVATVHDLVWRDHPETMAWRKRFVAWWLERGLRRTDRIVCISEFTRQRLTAHFPSLEPICRVILSGPNPRLAGLADVPLPEAVDRPFVLTVGTLEPRKNMALLLEAMRLLPDLLLVHCGPIGWNVAREVALARTLPNVRLLGYQDETVLASLYRRAVAAVFPSMYEGFHLPPLDAASLGCPVIASDIPVHREILGSGAAYVPLRDAAELAGAIRRLAQATVERPERAAPLRARAAQLSWKHAARQLADVFREFAR